MTRRGNTMIKWTGTPALAMGLAVGAAHQAEAETLYSETFSDGTLATPTDLNGSTPDITIGTNTWTASEWQENGSTATIATSGTFADLANNANDDSAFLAFTPETGKIYTLSATITVPTNGVPSGWAALGFTANNTTTGSFWANGSAPWVLYRPDTNVDTFAESLSTAPNNDLGVDNSEDEGDFATSADFEIVLNTEGAAWTAEWLINGSSVRSVTYGTNPTIGYVGFARENSNVTALDNFTLTVVPEPGSLTLLGLGGLCVLRRRRDS